MPPKRPHSGGSHRAKAQPHPAAQIHGHQPADTSAAAPPTGPYIDMFMGFRDELDRHHDRRERVIKASRDITAASKKIIFTLQRLRPTALPLRTLPPHITAEIHTYESRVQQLLTTLLPDLQGINAQRYGRQYSPAVQEYLEAVGFRQYLVDGGIVSFEEAGWYVSGLNADAVLGVKKPEGTGDVKAQEGDVEMVDAATAGDKDDGGETGEKEEVKEKLHGITLTREDYVLAMFDVTGEMMRFAITNLRILQTAFESLGIGNSPFGREADRKLEVTRQSVSKIEYAFYGMVVRGSERPDGWVADAGGPEGE
ncbi:hypothetical protein ABW21_db0209865 [Orbilia brochopaga]|nr:hypothetical protein ABW21_db0209865 [Drechslerella brochopaga]